MTNCIFCESEFADPILPTNRQKICTIFEVTFNGKKLLHDGKICTRCQVQVELVENALKLKNEMNQCLQDKLRSGDDHSHTNGGNLSHFAMPAVSDLKREPNGPLALLHTTSAVSHMNTTLSDSNQKVISPTSSFKSASSATSPIPPPDRTPSVAANIPITNASLPYPIPSFLAAQTAAAAAAVAASSSPSAVGGQQVLSPPDGVPVDGRAFMCVHCGQAFKEHSELVAHGPHCKLEANSPITAGCDRCGQCLKYRSQEDRIKHIIQCKGQGLRRGRPSIGIANCPKCGLSLKNRMNHDRMNHVKRCNGNGLKRGRPSLKADEKFKCDKCGRNLWSRDQLQLHAEKCDGNHVERRGRKPGDNSCMVCGENLVYRHILKKHLRQAHGINPQNLDDSVIAAVKNEQVADELSTPYKKILLNQIQQKLANPSAGDDIDDLQSSDMFDNNEQDSLNLSANSSISHRKKTKPTKYITNGLFKCDKCDKRFEYQSLFEQHCCFKMAADERSMDGGESTNQSVDEHSESMVIDEGGSNNSTSEDGLNDFGDEEQMSNKDSSDVVSAISKRAEIKPPSCKGSAIAQVISGLILANKNNGNTNSNTSMSSASIKQSISA